MKKLIKRSIFKKQRVNNFNQLWRSIANYFHMRFPLILFLLIVLFKIRTIFSHTSTNNKSNSSCLISYKRYVGTIKLFGGHNHFHFKNFFIICPIINNRIFCQLINKFKVKFFTLFREKFFNRRENKLLYGTFCIRKWLFSSPFFFYFFQ